jgi:hypothetical protein
MSQNVRAFEVIAVDQSIEMGTIYWYKSDILKAIVPRITGYRPSKE